MDLCQEIKTARFLFYFPLRFIHQKKTSALPLNAGNTKVIAAPEFSSLVLVSGIYVHFRCSGHSMNMFFFHIDCNKGRTKSDTHKD